MKETIKRKKASARELKCPVCGKPAKPGYKCGKSMRYRHSWVEHFKPNEYMNRFYGVPGIIELKEVVECSEPIVRD